MRISDLPSLAEISELTKSSLNKYLTNPNNINFLAIVMEANREDYYPLIDIFYELIDEDGVNQIVIFHFAQLLAEANRFIEAKYYIDVYFETVKSLEVLSRCALISIQNNLYEKSIELLSKLEELDSASKSTILYLHLAFCTKFNKDEHIPKLIQDTLGIEEEARNEYMLLSIALEAALKINNDNYVVLLVKRIQELNAPYAVNKRIDGFVKRILHNYLINLLKEKSE